MKTHTEIRPVAPARRSAPPIPSRSRAWPRVALAVAVLAGMAVAGLWWFVLRHDTPPPATLDQALAGVSAPAGSAATSTVDGTWTIDRTITNAQGLGSFTGFRVDEVLAGIGSSTAVGRTSNLDGTLTVQGTTLQAATITANLTGIVSNDSRRDGAIQRALDTSRFPSATFVLTQPVDVGKVPAEGERITTSATGDLTIHGVTRSVTLDVQAQLQNGVLVVVGTTDVSFSDYGVTAPTAPIVASVDDHGTVELQLYFTKA